MGMSRSQGAGAALMTAQAVMTPIWSAPEVSGGGVRWGTRGSALMTAQAVMTPIWSAPELSEGGRGRLCSVDGACSDDTHLVCARGERKQVAGDGRIFPPMLDMYLPALSL